jgi:hypothetical protein
MPGSFTRHSKGFPADECSRSSAQGLLCIVAGRLGVLGRRSDWQKCFIYVFISIVKATACKYTYVALQDRLARRSS